MKLDYRGPLTTGQKRTTKIVVNTLFLLLTKNNFDAITVREICKLSLIPHSTFYNYFEDKYDVYKWACFSRFNEIYPNPDASMNHYENIPGMIDPIYDFLDENKTLFRKIARHNPRNETLFNLTRQCLADYTEIVFRHCTSGVDYEVPIEVVFDTYVDGMFSIFVQTIYGGKNYTREQVRNYLTKLYNRQ